MTKLRVTLTFDYEVDELGTEAYGTDDPVEMAKIDEDQFQKDPVFFMELFEYFLTDDESINLTVEPVE